MTQPKIKCCTKRKTFFKIVLKEQKSLWKITLVLNEFIGWINVGVVLNPQWTACQRSSPLHETQ